jgi:eukaryotic-like serine/threonine-protein kinase
VNDGTHSSPAPGSDETVLQPSPMEAQEPKVCSPKRDVATGALHLTTETESILRLRLRAAALMLLIGFSAFLVRHVVGVLTNEPLDAALLGFHVLVVLVLSFILAVLWLNSDTSIKRLRFAELLIFGFPAAFFLMLQQRVTLDAGSRSFLPPPLPFWLLLIFTYGMFIPNTWRRGALVIGAMAVAPIVLLVGMLLAIPKVAESMTITGITQHVLVLVIAGAASAVGTHLITTLRREVHEAKQLGQYRLLRTIGSGGMGHVYLAEHTLLKRPCAIKLIHPDRAGDARTLARFEREVRMTAQLSHWNTIEIFDFGRTDDGTFFYVMEYLPGLSLQDLLDRYGPLPAERVVHLLRQLCQALREAHQVGLIHRDIKPANVFAAKRGGLYDVVKLLDFGLVKPVDENPSVSLSQEGGISGTPLYMSPEQARGQSDLDGRSDIYSLGALAYTLLTRRPPFEGTNPIDVVISHARDEVVWPAQHELSVPADLERIVLRCLAKRREDRFQDAQSLEQALTECAAADQWTQWHAARWWQEHEESTPASRTDDALALA